MKQIILIGRPNSGKTLFAIHFAEYLGVHNIRIVFRAHNGIVTSRRFTPEEAKRELCGPDLHKTKHLQSVTLNMPIGRTNIDFLLNDTCGIAEEIHPDKTIRRGMAQTLNLMRQADYIFHMIDASQPAACHADGKSNKNTNIDSEIYYYGIVRSAYSILVNKIDIVDDSQCLKQVQSRYPQAAIIPVSALHGTGFREVKACVGHNI
ncbi:GTPase [Acetonema longum]|uniref:GTP-binding protein HSR1-related protein n=1 Tax=Acetonema longum DSM 6540 TaxID=1009370 RepID=F7NPC6_9FIRM|nr:GTPase [Acetonema longum]EGO62088.1 GTP-binding protein HSR1-related protein [Acetonema longum DSM 6540]